MLLYNSFDIRGFSSLFLRFLANIALLSIGLQSGVALASSNQERPLVVSSIRPLQIIVDDIAGDLVESKSILGGSSSPHHASVTMSQAKSLNAADLLVWIGPGFEVFIAGAVDASIPQVRFQKEAVHHVHEEHRDLHLWLDPIAVAEFVMQLSDKLVEILPKEAGKIKRNRDAYLFNLTTLHSEIEARFAKFQNRKFIAFHSAYDALIDRYALEQVAYLTEVPDEQVSARRVASVKSQAATASCLMAESGEKTLSSRYARVLGLPLVTTNLLATNSTTSSYEAYMRELVTTFERCFEQP